jgi:uncharacterized protein (DUF1330 family)
MPTIIPEQSTLDEFVRQVPDGEPIVMINLLRYRDWADLKDEQVTGRQCYERYERAVLPLVSGVGGRPIWRGRPRFVVIGPKGEEWEDAILVRYPSRTAFERMVNSPEYLAIMHFRTAALADSRLIATTAPQNIGLLAWSIFRFSSWLRQLVGRKQ